MEYVEGGTIGVHVCPGRYVSRMIRYGREPDAGQLKGFVQKALQGTQEVVDADVRVAKRYAWDLGIKSERDDLVLTEAYWTQNYRRAKSEDPDRAALFICANGDAFYVQRMTGSERFCQRCRGKAGQA
ncbi:MAG: hypothetical protein JRN21_05920 [Nitrososphaerota archaeon]|nr:hypothetical protein [Nitrososphaerota archaeon]